MYPVNPINPIPVSVQLLQPICLKIVASQMLCCTSVVSGYFSQSCSSISIHFFFLNNGDAIYWTHSKITVTPSIGHILKRFKFTQEQDNDVYL